MFLPSSLKSAHTPGQSFLSELTGLFPFNVQLCQLQPVTGAIPDEHNQTLKVELQAVVPSSGEVSEGPPIAL